MSPSSPSSSPALPESPIRGAVVAQLGGCAIVAAIHGVFPGFFSSMLMAALVQGLCAALIGFSLCRAPWWPVIHMAFMPAIVLASRCGLAPGWYLGAFILLLLVYWRTDKSQVPLYLSNAATAEALALLLPKQSCRVVDLGCGHGGLLRRLARARPDCRFLGIEHAPLPWLWARLAGIGQTNLKIRYGDFWSEPLSSYDVVYAFLSPRPMPRLMAQALAQMRRGTLLVSNSFAVPDAQAEGVVEVADRRATKLFCYRLPGAKGC
jgi:SAM-dependent methyltransferase